MIVKVKEPQPGSRDARPRHLLFTYLHLAADSRRPRLMKSGATCIAYETVTAQRRAAAAEADERGRGRMSIQVGAHYSRRSRAAAACCSAACRASPRQGRDPRRRRCGVNAAQMAVGHARRRHHLDISNERLAELDMFSAPDQDRLSTATASPTRCGRAGDRRGAGPRRRRAEAGHRDMLKAMKPARCWSTSPSTRAAASRPATRLPTTTRSTRSTA